MIFQEAVKNLVILARSILLRFKGKYLPVKIRPMLYCQPRKVSGVNNLADTGLLDVLKYEVLEPIFKL